MFAVHQKRIAQRKDVEKKKRSKGGDNGGDEAADLNGKKPRVMRRRRRRRRSIIVVVVPSRTNMNRGSIIATVRGGIAIDPHLIHPTLRIRPTRHDLVIAGMIERSIASSLDGSK